MSCIYDQRKGIDIQDSILKRDKENTTIDKNFLHI